MKLVFLLVAVAISLMADTRFRVQKMTREVAPFGKGQCDIRLEIDKDAEVHLHDDSLFVRTLSGREARDDGSACNEGLPAHGVQGFHFEVLDSRGEVYLLQPPSRHNDYTAVVRIRDNEGGSGQYHFRLSWNTAGYDPERDPRPRQAFAMQKGVQLCEAAVTAQILDQYHYGDVNIRNIRADDNPGRRDYLMGEASAHRGFHGANFTFVCVVDFNSGRVGSVDVRKR